MPALRWREIARATMVVCLVSLARATPAISAVATLESLLVKIPADSLAGPLRRLEASSTPAEGAEVAMTLGQYHFARGEYREAVTAFGRAAARMPPERKPLARYWMGISWLGASDPSQARSALENVATLSSDLRIPALLGIAQAWELARRPDRALETLAPLAELRLDESGAAVLDRVGALADRVGRSEVARRARLRLLNDYPRSAEAAQARLALALPPRSGAGGIAVVIGSFLDPGRARALAGEARRAGFPAAEVVTRGARPAVLHVVRLGIYDRPAQARSAGEQAERALGVVYEIERGR